VHGVASSWLKWGDLVVDTGRELQLPTYAGVKSSRPALLRPAVPYVNMLLYGPRVYVEVLVGRVRRRRSCAWASPSLSKLPWSGLRRVGIFVICARISTRLIFNFVLPCSTRLPGIGSNMGVH
jgi:hypothetical protein